ncbi:MAG TPA: hypothetical protein VK212_03075 [Lentimicrobium sp.]|nr:hypothetical protein [Lentimicrobium sp.]
MKKLWMIVIAAALFISCNKEEGDKPITLPPDYANLKVGNYWIYQHFKIDTTGEETALDKYDSCYVEKDTVINGKTFYKMIRPRAIYSKYVYLWRDSSGYIVNTSGKIWFFAEDFTTVFDTTYAFGAGDTTYVATSRMVDKDKVVTTPAGDFVTRTYQIRYDLEEWLTPYSPRFSNMRFTKDIGIVSETLDIYALNPFYTERRLVRYGSNK